jgi:hypothetical protein
MKTLTSFRAFLVFLAVLLVTSPVESGSIFPPQFVPNEKAAQSASGDHIAPEIAGGPNLTLAAWRDMRALPGSVLVPFLERESSFGNGGTYFGRTAFHTLSSPGTYTVSLTVLGSRGSAGTAMQSVVVQ